MHQMPFAAFPKVRFNFDKWFKVDVICQTSLFTCYALLFRFPFCLYSFYNENLLVLIFPHSLRTDMIHEIDYLLKNSLGVFFLEQEESISTNSASSFSPQNNSMCFCSLRPHAHLPHVHPRMFVKIADLLYLRLQSAFKVYLNSLKKLERNLEDQLSGTIEKKKKKNAKDKHERDMGLELLYDTVLAKLPFVSQLFTLSSSVQSTVSQRECVESLSVLRSITQPGAGPLVKAIANRTYIFCIIKKMIW